MSKYQIEWMEKGETSTGKVKANATLVDEQGVKTEVTIWGNFPNFATLMSGGEVEGELKASSDPKYKPSLTAPRTPKTASTGGFKQKMIEDTMEKKNSSIRAFQGDKEYSIKVSSTFRAAVDTALAEINAGRGGDIEELFNKWRKFYWSKFDVNITDFPPF